MKLSICKVMLLMSPTKYIGIVYKLSQNEIHCDYLERQVYQFLTKNSLNASFGNSQILVITKKLQLKVSTACGKSANLVS